MDLNLNTGHPKTMEDKNTRQKTSKQTTPNHSTTKDIELSYLLNMFLSFYKIIHKKGISKLLQLLNIFMLCSSSLFTLSSSFLKFHISSLTFVLN